MAFTPRTWIARIVQYPGRRILTPTGNINEYDVARSEGSIDQAGDSISAEALNDLEQRILTGLASGTNGDANNALKLAGVDATAIIDGEGNALNALKLGGVDAANFPQISSGTWTPTILGSSVAGSPTYNSSLRSGSWLKDGKRVSLFGVISVTAFNDVSGNILLGGLPFAPAERSSGSVGWNGVPEATGKIALQLVPSEMSGNIQILKGNSTYLTTSDVTSLLLAAIRIDYLTNS